jgi:hypothetical protein
MNLSTNGKLPREEGIRLYRTMARLLITSQNFTLLRDEKSVEEEAKRTRVSWVTIQPQPKRDTGTAISCEILKDFLPKLCKVSTELDDLKNQFLTKVTLQASKFPEAELYRLWLPFLHSAIPLFHENSIPLSTQSCQKFFSAVVKAVLDVCLGPQPPRPADWSLSSVPCNCGDCERVNDFSQPPNTNDREVPDEQKPAPAYPPTSGQSRHRVQARNNAKYKPQYVGHDQENSASGRGAAALAESKSLSC